MGDSNGNGIGKLEGRWVSFLTAIALMFGGWWLQNQYETILRIQAQLTAFQQHVDDGYVRKEYLNTIAERVRRNEEKLDKLEELMREEAVRDAGPNR